MVACEMIQLKYCMLMLYLLYFEINYQNYYVQYEMMFQPGLRGLRRSSANGPPVHRAEMLIDDFFHIPFRLFNRSGIEDHFNLPASKREASNQLLPLIEVLPRFIVFTSVDRE